MGVSWFGSRARQDRVNNRAKGMSLSVKGISLSTKSVPRRCKARKQTKIASKTKSNSVSTAPERTACSAAGI